MEEDVILESPMCIKCGSKQIRTTKEYHVCVRCGHEEKR